MAKKKAKANKAEQTETVGGAWQAAAWVAILAVWAFTTISLIAFDPADPPTHLVAPHNSPPENWCGPVGAFIAYHLIRLFGVGVLVLVLAGVAYLMVTLTRQRINHLGVRVVGVLMLAASAGGFQALLLPESGPMPGLAGGLIGSEGTIKLMESFGPLGAGLWLFLLGAIGAIVAFDRWLITAPRWIYKKSAPAAALAGAQVGTAARAGSGVVSGLSGMVKKPVKVRIDDLDDDKDIPHRDELERERKAAKSKRRTSGAEKYVEAAEPEDHEEEYDEDDYEDDYGDYEDEDGDYEDDEEYDYDEEDAIDEGEDAELEEDELPGAPQVFSKEELRAKIEKLPVIFAKDNRRVATEDDLKGLQSEAVLEGYKFPGLDLLEEPEENFTERLEEIVREQAEALEHALQQYRIKGEVVGIESGPVITLYDVRLAPGTKVSQLTSVSSDIARALRAVNIRIVPNQAGRDTVGIEVPNPTKEKVRLMELMSRSEIHSKMKLPMFLGKDASGEPLIADLTKMPHMLIAGTTGSGKSVCMNTIIMGFLYTKKPNELKLVLVDPKMVEMSQFKHIPHLMCPVVTEMTRAAAILEWACKKMDERYELLAEAGCRDIAAYNALTWEEKKERFEPASEAEEGQIPRHLPYMVFIIDELADLMMTAKEVEGSIIRIAQKARAVGIHLILATQRPQANVVTGLIKSNMPSRISFKVASGMDSRIVLDQKGGELLLGQGDMLYLSPSSHKLTRAQGTLVDDAEIRRVVRFMKDVATPTFERSLVQLRSGDADEERILESKNNSSASLRAAQEDPMFDRAVEIILESGRGSVSLLQRRLAIGYTRASRLVDLMGIAGIIGEHKGSVAREVVITPEMWQAMKQQAAEDAAAGRLPEQEGQGDLFAAAGNDGASEREEAEAGTSTFVAEEPPFEADDDSDAEGPTRELAGEEEEEWEDEEAVDEYEEDDEGYEEDEGEDGDEPFDEAENYEEEDEGEYEGDEDQDYEDDYDGEDYEEDEPSERQHRVDS
jgi:S-DNA-T family DNA segregation ATPase FtsK/SpoIIIE